MAEWTKLFPAPWSSTLPQLYVKAAITGASYTIYLTDLVYIWGESLDRRAIMRRAMDEDTSIDPTNGADQLKHLLDHVSGCLQGQTDTCVKIDPQSTMNELRLTLVSTLPAPLEPLRWPLVLSLDGKGCFSTHLLQPALRGLERSESEIRGLVNVIREKDHVIQKLQDKLEVAGLDLSSIFPGAGIGGGRKASERGITNRLVPGLKEFDYESWLRSASGHVHDKCTLPRVTDSNLLDSGAVEFSWWEKLHGTLDGNTDADEPKLQPSQTLSSAIPQRNKSPSKNSVSSTSSEEQSVDVRPGGSAQDGHSVSGAEEEDGASVRHDGTSSIQVNFEQGQSPISGATQKRIGLLGGKKEMHSRECPPAVEKELKTGIDSGVSASPSKRISKLGKIGGVPKASARKENDSNETSGEKNPLNRSSSGQIIKTESMENVESTTGQDTTTLTRHNRETSQERADRRRAELKHQLEERKKVPATKKKQRRF